MTATIIPFPARGTHADAQVESLYDFYCRDYIELLGNPLDPRLYIRALMVR